MVFAFIVILSGTCMEEREARDVQSFIKMEFFSAKRPLILRNAGFILENQSLQWIFTMDLLLRLNLLSSSLSFT